MYFPTTSDNLRQISYHYSSIRRLWFRCFETFSEKKRRGIAGEITDKNYLRLTREAYRLRRWISVDYINATGRCLFLELFDRAHAFAYEINAAAVIVDDDSPDWPLSADYLRRWNHACRGSRQNMFDRTTYKYTLVFNASNLFVTHRCVSAAAEARGSAAIKFVYTCIAYARGTRIRRMSIRQEVI